MEPPQGFWATLWNFICFLPYFIGLLILGIIKGALLCPLIFLIIAIGNSAIIFGLWPVHIFWTWYCILRAKLFGPVLKFLLCICVSAVLIAWPVIGIVGSILGGLVYGFLSPLFATFEAIEEGKTNKFFNCLFDGTLSAVKGSFTVVRDFMDVCFYSYFSLMDDLCMQEPKDGEPYDIRLLYLPGAVIVGVLGISVDFVVITCMAAIKSPYMLFKGWHQLFHDMIGREGPFLETICVPFAGLAIILWPVVVVVAVICSMVSSIFLGAFAGVIAYQLDEKPKQILKKLLYVATEAIQSQTQMTEEKSRNSSIRYNAVPQCQTSDDLHPTFPHEKSLGTSLSNIHCFSRELNCKKCGKKRPISIEEKKNPTDVDDSRHFDDPTHSYDHEAGSELINEKKMDPVRATNRQVQGMSLMESSQSNSSKFHGMSARSESGCKNIGQRQTMLVNVIQEEVAHAIQRIEARIPYHHQIINFDPTPQRDSTVILSHEDLKHNGSVNFHHQLPKYSVNLKSQKFPNNPSSMAVSLCGPSRKIVNEISSPGQVPTKAGSPTLGRSEFPVQFASQAPSRLHFPSKMKENNIMEKNDAASTCHVQSQNDRHHQKRKGSWSSSLQYTASPSRMSSMNNSQLLHNLMTKHSSSKERTAKDTTMPGQIRTRTVQVKSEPPFQFTVAPGKSNQKISPSCMLSHTIQERSENYFKTDSSSQTTKRSQRGTEENLYAGHISSQTGKRLYKSREMSTASQIRTELNKGIGNTTTVPGKALSSSRLPLPLQQIQTVKKCGASVPLVDSKKGTLARKPSLVLKLGETSNAFTGPSKPLKQQMITMPTLMDQKPKIAPLRIKPSYDLVKGNSQLSQQKARLSLSSSASSSSWTSEGTTISNSESSVSSISSSPRRMSSLHRTGPTSRARLLHVRSKPGTRSSQISVKSFKTGLSRHPNHAGFSRLTRIESTEKKVGRLKKLKNKLGVIFHHHHHHHHHHHKNEDASTVGHPTLPKPDHSLWKHLRNTLHRSNREDRKHPAVIGTPRHHQQGGHFHALIEGLFKHAWHSKKSKSYKDEITRSGKKYYHKKAVKKWHWWQKFHRQGRGVGLANSGRRRVKIGFKANRPKAKKHFYLA